MRSELTDGERQERLRNGLCVSCGKPTKEDPRGRHYVPNEDGRSGGTYVCTGERYTSPPSPYEQREAARDEALATYATPAVDGLWTFGEGSRTFTRQEAIAVIFTAQLLKRQVSTEVWEETWADPMCAIVLMILQLTDRVDALEMRGLGGLFGGLF